MRGSRLRVMWRGQVCGALGHDGWTYSADDDGDGSACRRVHRVSRQQRRSRVVDRAVCPGQEHCGNTAAVATNRKGRPLLNTSVGAVGPPSYAKRNRENRTIYSLGCQGWAVWEFFDNVIVDTPGPDIFVFEVGRSKEATAIELSEDGERWTAAGSISGSSATADIHDFVEPGQKFHFIRLTDLGTSCRNGTPGADIDAVAAIAYSWTDTASDAEAVLFDLDSSELQPGAAAFLDAVIARIPPDAYRIQVEGHTDSRGTDDHNRLLSKRRADAVALYISTHSAIPSEQVATFGFGETVPIEPNEPDGNPANRRVEITAIPLEACRQR
jgi:outer membrane protein OmpA-like peptidoglycan-associated protein